MDLGWLVSQLPGAISKKTARAKGRVAGCRYTPARTGTAMTATHHLYTFGYEGLDIDAFVARLRAAGIQTIVDVRELPLSRKKGFSKSSFSAGLADAGVAYLHAPALGCPKVIRDQYKVDGDWTSYTRKFLAYIETQDAVVRELVKLSKATKACLVCFEADYTLCHRTYVARATRKRGGPTVMHLTARKEFADSGLRAVA